MPQTGPWTGDPVWIVDILRAEGVNPVEYPGWRAAGTVTSRIFAVSWCTTPDPIALVPPRLPKVALILRDRYPSCTSPAMAR
ncbi:Bacteriophage protein [Mycobacteroides abscessus]|nr:Bacteriophage protein [Mycobacteroides abscessus]